MTLTTPCRRCGTPFPAVDNRTKYCSDACRRQVEAAQHHQRYLARRGAAAA